MDAPNFDVDSLRHIHESDAEWKMRKAFLSVHKDKFPMKRLLCLASCFINYECYGCQYPGPVMVQIKELTKELPDEVEEHREKMRTLTQVKFVKAKEEDGPSPAKIAKGGMSKPNLHSKSVKPTNSSETWNNKPLYSNFVSSGDKFSSCQTGSSQNYYDKNKTMYTDSSWQSDADAKYAENLSMHADFRDRDKFPSWQSTSGCSYEAKVAINQDNTADNTFSSWQGGIDDSASWQTPKYEETKSMYTNFVKAGENIASHHSSKTSMHGENKYVNFVSSQPSSSSKNEEKISGKTKMSFVKASETLNSVETALHSVQTGKSKDKAILELEKCFDRVKTQVKILDPSSDPSVLHNIASKEGMRISVEYHQARPTYPHSCNLFINEVLVSFGSAPTKKKKVPTATLR